MHRAIEQQQEDQREEEEGMEELKFG